MKEVLSATADTLLEKPVSFVVNQISFNWWERIAIRFRLMKANKVFQIRPATLGTMVRISQLVLRIDGDVFKDKSYLEGSFTVYEQHGLDLATLVALAVSNSKQEPNSKLVDFLMYNLSGKELLSISKVVLDQLDVTSFLSTIISVRGMSLLNTEGTIASGEPSEE